MTRDRNIVLVLAVLLTVLAAVLALVTWLPPHMVSTRGLTPDQRATHIAAARTAVLQALAGMGILASIFYTASGLRLNRQGQLTERFSKAVEQLGSDKVDVRIGGIYALERVMRDSPADHGPIVEVLTAFVREHAKDRGTIDPNEAKLRDVAGPPAPGLLPVAADVQAAVTVIARRPDRPETGRLDMRDADLRGVRARAARFAEAVMTDVKLDYADLGEADFTNARLRKASLSGAWLRAATFSGASLRYVNLSRAQLRDADLGTADLEHAILDGAEVQRTSWPSHRNEPPRR